jgi:hypothetical protein
MSILLSATALVLAAQSIGYWPIERLNQIHEDSKTICAKALINTEASRGYIRTQGQRLDYEPEEILVLFQFCETYISGVTDGIEQTIAVLEEEE